MTRPTPRPESVPDEWSVRETTRDGVTITSYRRSGDGEPLACVHGLVSWGPDLFALVEALGDYDAVVMDVRGHGRSDAAEGGYDLDTVAADLDAVVRDAGLDEPVVLGHSLGGGTVTTYAADYGASAVVALDPVGLLGRGVGGERDSSWVLERIESGRAELEAGAAGTAPGLDTGREDALRAAAAVGGSPYADERVAEFIDAAVGDPRARYERIDCPMLFVRADVPAAEREGDAPLVASALDARVAYVADAGHCVHRDRLGRTAALAAAFLVDVGLCAGLGITPAPGATRG